MKGAALIQSFAPRKPVIPRRPRPEGVRGECGVADCAQTVDNGSSARVHRTRGTKVGRVRRTRPLVMNPPRERRRDRAIRSFDPMDRTDSAGRIRRTRPTAESKAASSRRTPGRGPRTARAIQSPPPGGTWRSRLIGARARPSLGTILHFRHASGPEGRQSITWTAGPGGRCLAAWHLP